MRIVLVVPQFPKLSETFIVSKFLGLLASGKDMHVVCRTSKPAAWDIFARLQNRPDLRKRVHITWPVNPRVIVGPLLVLALLRCLLLRPRTTVTYLLQGWRRFGLTVARHFYLDHYFILLKPDVVHVEFGALAVDYTHLPELLDCQLVVSFRGYDLNYVALDEPDFYTTVWRNASIIHLLGDDLWQRALRRGCPPGMPHALISPAIDVEAFDAGQRDATEVVGSATRPLRLLSVGRLEWKKGYEFALLAVRYLVEDGLCVEYHIIGDGDFMVAVSFARHALGLEDVVHFDGSQPPEQVQAMLRWADVFLHAAVSEGFCNAVMEAQSMQVPVVTSDADGLAENVRDGVTGYVVPRRDPRALAEKVAELAADPDRRLQMGLAGRAHVKENFTLDKHINQFLEMYDRIKRDR